MSMRERLQRLMFVVPYVVQRDGVPLSDLAKRTGVSRAQMLADIELLSLVGQPPLTPDHLIDLYVEDDVVYVELDQNLSRPQRLTHDEAAALVLGAKMVGDLGGLGQKLQSVLNKILEALNPAEQDMVHTLSKSIAIWQSETAPSKPVSFLREAMEQHREAQIEYYSASSDRAKTYHIQPLALLTHSGVEYLLALDVDSQLQEKLFRLDRMASAQLLNACFEAPKELDLERFRTEKLYAGSVSTQVEVRFAPAVARRVQESFAGSPMQKDRDGSVRVFLSTSSPAWLARFVLPFGKDAEVIAPKEHREYLQNLCKQAARAYAKTT